MAQPQRSSFHTSHPLIQGVRIIPKLDPYTIYEYFGPLVRVKTQITLSNFGSELVFHSGTSHHLQLSNMDRVLVADKLLDGLSFESLRLPGMARGHKLGPNYVAPGTTASLLERFNSCDRPVQWVEANGSKWNYVQVAESNGYIRGWCAKNLDEEKYALQFIWKEHSEGLEASMFLPVHLWEMLQKSHK
jgi:hypothetical protein